MHRMILLQGRSLLICLMLCIVQQMSVGFVILPSPLQQAMTAPYSVVARHMVDSVTLDVLPPNHDVVAEEMAESIVKWLDAEWMPQEVHQQMANSCKKSYVECREAGKDDLTDVMIKVADDLSDRWGEYDKDAFVNAWDIANYVSDFLTAKAGIEGCECSARIY